MNDNKTDKSFEININDVFVEISNENKRLKQLINVLIEFKEFCDSIVSQLDSNEIQRYQDLREKLNQFNDSELSVALNRPKMRPVVDIESTTLTTHRKYKKISNDMRLLIIQMLDSGRTVTDVANMFGVSPNSIRTIYRRYQLTGIAYNRKTTDFPPKVFTKEQEEEIRQWYQEEPSLTLNDMMDKCVEVWPNIDGITTDAVLRCFTDFNAKPNSESHSTPNIQHLRLDFNQDIGDESSMAVQSITEKITEPQNQSKSTIEDTNDQSIGQSESEGEEGVGKEETMGEESDEEVSKIQQTKQKEDNSETDEAHEREDNSEKNVNQKGSLRKKPKKIPRLSTEMRELAVKMIDNGTKVSKVAKIFGRQDSTIAMIYRKYKERGSVQLKSKYTAKRSLTEDQVKLMKQWFKDDPSLTQKELKDKALEKWPDVGEVSSTTISRYLKDIKIKRIKKLKRAVDDSPYVCSICQREFQYKASMKKHMEIHNPADSYSCDLCSFTTKTKIGLRGHVDTMHGPNVRPFKCHFQGCGKDFRNKYTLKTHIAAIHAPPETVVCDIEGCGRVLKNKRCLRVHLRLYHGEAKFGCEWPGCDYKAKGLSTLKNHQMVHSNERKFVCDWSQCGKQFKVQRHLEEHQRIHLNDRKYLCQWPGCQYSCVFGGNLKKHMRVHQK